MLGGGRPDERYQVGGVTLPEVHPPTRQEPCNPGFLELGGPEMAGQVVVRTKRRDVLLDFNTLSEQHQSHHQGTKR